jgi:hypothetical protein
MPAGGAIRAVGGVTLETKPRRRYAVRSVVAVTGLLVAAVAVAVAAPGVAGASTLDGVATIASPGTTTELPSGGSTTQFTISLPPQAACSGDTETDGYHVFSYLVEAGTSVTGITFPDNLPNTADNQYGLVEADGTYWGAKNTAPSTGQIINIPNDFEWGPLVSSDHVALKTLLYGKKNKTGAWDAGLACTNTSGTVTDYWLTQVTFTSSTSDPNGFTWSAIPGSFRVTTTSLPAATIGQSYSTTVSAAGGTTPYKVKATGLPKGLKMASTTGTISGTPSTKDKAEAYSVSVTVTDAAKPKGTATAALSLTLNAA